jgi:hypothetical protein
MATCVDDNRALAINLGWGAKIRSLNMQTTPNDFPCRTLRQPSFPGKPIREVSTFTFHFAGIAADIAIFPWSRIAII